MLITRQYGIWKKEEVKAGESYFFGQLIGREKGNSEECLQSGSVTMYDEDGEPAIVTYNIKAYNEGKESPREACVLVTDIYLMNTKGIPWYTENWYDTDLENALENAGVEVNEENLAAMKEACQKVFDDKSERNEILCHVARTIKTAEKCRSGQTLEERVK